jgi:hypothetical protein
VNGGAQNDTFTIVPSTATEFKVDGFGSTDSLSIDTVVAGATIKTSTSTEFTFEGDFKKITYQNIENVEDLPPTITGSGSFTGAEDANIDGILTATSSGGYSLTFLPLTYPANGTLKLGANGKFVYTPTRHVHLPRPRWQWQVHRWNGQPDGNRRQRRPSGERRYGVYELE